MNKTTIITLLFLFVSCNAEYIQDSNATVFDTSQYENEITWVYPLLEPEKYKPQANCKNKDDLSCSVILYKDSYDFMKEGEKLACEKLYLSASIEYLQALSRLYEAEIRINRSKRDKSGLMKKVLQRINTCEKKLRLYEKKHKEKHSMDIKKLILLESISKS